MRVALDGNSTSNVRRLFPYQSESRGTMADRTTRLLAALALGALPLVTSPLAASAQTSQFYSPPKIIKQGANATPIAGSGSVTLKVFVHKDGSVGTVEVEKSTNHADDAAATEIAKGSTYKPGARDGKPIDAYYTMSLKFSGNAVQTDSGAGGGDMAQANALVRAGKYDEAKVHLQSYLTGHPGDKDAQALLGVSDFYLKDAAGATAAFDAAGTIPDRLKSVAANAYADAAVDALKAKNNDQAITLADKALGLQANVNTLFIRGTANGNLGKYAAAIADFEKAKALAASGKSDAATMNSIDAGLVTAYLFGGQSDKGLALAKDVKRRDPSNARVDDAVAGYYSQQAGTAMQAGKKDQAVAALEAGAQALPSRAASLYGQAANLLASGTSPDWKKVKAEADKALAADPNDGHANFIAGVALANTGDKTGAIPLIQKAKANAGSDAKLLSDAEAALKQLGAKQ
jgi:TonB family protein